VSTGEKVSGAQRISGWLSLVGVCALYTASAFRIHTYVTGQDPYWYIALARRVLGGPELPGELGRIGVQFVSPGFTLVLAAAIRLFGLYAPHWINLGLGILFFIVYAALIRRLLSTPWAVPFFLGVTFLVVVSSYPLHIHFLLYPFRGMAVYTLVFTGFWIILLIFQQWNYAPAFLVAGIPFALAAAIREPAVFALAGALPFTLWSGGVRRRGGWVRAGYLLLPTVCGALLLLAFGASTGMAVNHQMAAWTKVVFGNPLHIILAQAGISAGDMLRYLHSGVGWAGILLIFIGIYRMRRQPAAICFFLVPGILLFIFYSLYIPHHRYFLTILLFLCPLLSAGVLQVLEWVAQALRRAGPGRAQWPAGIVLAGVFLLSILQVRAMSPWGRHVNAEDIAGFRRELSQLAPAGSAVYYEWACRYLADGLLCFAEFDHPDPETAQAALRHNPTGLYLQPLNASCYYEGYREGRLPSIPVTVEQILRFYADMIPMRDETGAVQTLDFAEGEFAVYRIQEWSSSEFETRLTLPSDTPLVLWWDFGERENVPVSFSIQTLQGERLFEVGPMDGRLIQGAAVPASVVSGEEVILRLSSDKPLPAEPLIGLQFGDRAFPCPLDAKRRISTHYWLQPPFYATNPRDSHAAVMTDGGRLELPVPFGEGFQQLQVLFVLRSPTPKDRDARVRYTSGGVTTPWREVSLNDPNTYHSLELPRPAGRHTVTVDLEIAYDDPRDAQVGLRLAHLTLKATDWEEQP
jgi:hypothetical protein